MDRFFDSLRLLVMSWFEERLFGLYPYVIESFDSVKQTISASPLNNPNLPMAPNMSIRSFGMKTTCSPGEQCIVAFEGGITTRPFVAFLGLASEYSSALPAMRTGDMVRSGGNGQLIAFYPTAAPPTPPFATLGIPYLVSFGTLVPPNPPRPPPFQTPLYGIGTTGGRTKVR